MRARGSAPPRSHVDISEGAGGESTGPDQIDQFFMCELRIGLHGRQQYTDGQSEREQQSKQNYQQALSGPIGILTVHQPDRSLWRRSANRWDTSLLVSQRFDGIHPAGAPRR